MSGAFSGCHSLRVPYYLVSVAGEAAVVWGGIGRNVESLVHTAYDKMAATQTVSHSGNTSIICVPSIVLRSPLSGVTRLIVKA